VSRHVPMWSTERGVSERRLLDLRTRLQDAFEEMPVVLPDELQELIAEVLHLREATTPIEVGDGVGTPGPWAAYRSGDTWHIRSVTAEVGIASVPPSEPGKVVRTDAADARLIAAAPDLLAACELALPHHQGGHSAVGAALRVAIAKATASAAQEPPK
jgi:hypothetical protein